MMVVLRDNTRQTLLKNSQTQTLGLESKVITTSKAVKFSDIACSINSCLVVEKQHSNKTLPFSDGAGPVIMPNQAY